MGECATMCARRSEHNLGKSVLSFRHVGPRVRTQELRLGCTHSYLSAISLALQIKNEIRGVIEMPQWVKVLSHTSLAI